MSMAESNVAAENEKLKHAINAMKSAEQSPSAYHQQQMNSLNVQLQMKGSMNEGLQDSLAKMTNAYSELRQELEASLLAQSGHVTRAPAVEYGDATHTPKSSSGIDKHFPSPPPPKTPQPK